MESVVPELHLLTEWGDPAEGQRRRTAFVATVLFHVAVVLILAFLPAGFFREPPIQEEVHHITPIYLPPTEFTQRAPNKTKVTKEFEARSEQPRPEVPVPTPPPAPKPQPRRAMLPPPTVPKPQPAPALPEAPKLDTAIKEPPKQEIQLPPLTVPAPPKIEEAENPKSPFDRVPEAATPVAPGHGKIPIPDTSVAGAIQQTVQSIAGGRTMVGDSSAMGPPGLGGLTQQPSGGVQGAALELKSDPTGVDFKPYLLRVLAAVKRNWQAVMPESVRLGRRGKVVCEFRITRNGTVQKIVFAEQSGSDPLDHAAVAGISASVPFPPFPAEFKGDNIVLRLNFVYNAPKR